MPLNWITQKLDQLGHLMGQVVLTCKLNYFAVIQILNRSHAWSLEYDSTW